MMNNSANKEMPALSQEDIKQIADQARQESIRDIVDELPDWFLADNLAKNKNNV